MEKDNYYLINTQMSGVWFGKFIRYFGTDACLAEARRIFDCSEVGSTLSEIASNGVSSYNKIMKEKSKIWLQPTEFELCTSESITSIQGKIEHFPALEDVSNDIDYNAASKLTDIYSSVIM